MSNFNYMDNIPVKIAESYRPPPRVYQMPQAISNKLALPAEHYEQASQYSYDFQLENILLTKLPEWRRLRQYEREARRERKQRRDQQRQQQLEAQQKKLLGAVSYPSAEYLSSCSSESEHKNDEEPLKVTPQVVSNSFHNILQPTILLPTDNSVQLTPVYNYHVNNFNYQDFEAGTSSPFDDIELKTINDLDILAQVLHNAQLKVDKNEIENVKNANNTNKNEEEDTINDLKHEEMQKNIPNESAAIIDQTNLNNGYEDTNIATVSFRNINHVKGAYDVYNSNNCASNLSESSNVANYNSDYYNINSCIPTLTTTTATAISTAATVTEIKSKSVPDILKELREEVRKSQMSRRTRNCSEAIDDMVKPEIQGN